MLLLALGAAPAALAAGEQHGQITFNALPVPGATVTASQGDTKIVVFADAEGATVCPDSRMARTSSALR